MIDSIMKHIVKKSLAAVFCFIGLSACYGPIQESGNEIILGIDRSVSLYPLGSRIDIPCYSAEPLYFTWEPEEGSSSWLEFQDEVDGMNHIRISAESNRGKKRSGKLYMSREQGGKDDYLSISQEPVSFAFAEDTLRIGALDSSVVSVSCASNVNYIVKIDSDVDVDYGTMTYFTSNDDGFNLISGIGEHNAEREMNVTARLLDDSGRESGDEYSFVLVQDPYDFYFLDDEGEKRTSLEVEISEEKQTALINLISSGEWIVDYQDYEEYESEEEDPYADVLAMVRLNGIPVNENEDLANAGESAVTVFLKKIPKNAATRNIVFKSGVYEISLKVKFTVPEE